MSHIMTELVIQLAVILIVARLTGFFFNRYLKQPRVLGELISGIIIGPYALGGMCLFGQQLFPPHVGHGSVLISTELYGIATIASIILLFRAGLETDLGVFLQYSVAGSTVGIGGAALCFVLGDFMTVLSGYAGSFMDPAALFMGTLSTATSVGITARILSEKKKMASPEGVTILSGAVIDDVLGIVILAVVVGISKASKDGSTVAWTKIGAIAGKAFGFWLVCTVLGIILAPHLTRALKWFKSNDIIASTSFGIALLLAGLSEHAGLAMIIGAYVAGLSLSQTDVVDEIHDRINALYQFLVPAFFCIMGMMVDVSAMKPVLLFGLAFSAVAMAGKLVGCGVPALFLGFNLRGALRVGAGMLPRGEVTLIVAGIGLADGIIDKELFGVAIMTLLVASIVAPPTLVKLFDSQSGMKKKVMGKKEESAKTITLDFPSPQVASFMLMRIGEAFRAEEFYVHRVDSEQDIFQIRKDRIVITLAEKDNTVSLTTAAEYEQLVRFMVLEVILELKDLLESAHNIQSPDAMGANILGEMFQGNSD